MSPKNLLTMNITGYFDETFSQEKLNGLMWIEKGRKSPQEYFGEETYDKLSRLGDIPAGLRDTFLYELVSPKIDIRFQQDYSQALPITTSQILSFLFKDETGFSPAKLLFRPDGIEHIRLESRDLDTHKDVGRFRGPNIFTESGKRIMEELISNRRNILGVRGMKLGDYCQLEKLLADIEEKYKKGDLDPEDIYIGT